MRLPELTEMATAKDNTEEFKGYNHNLRNEVGEWYDQKNMTTDYYPAASPRDKRAVQINKQSITLENGNDEYKTRNNLAIAHTDERLIVLQELKKIDGADETDAGCVFVDNGEVAGLAEDSEWVTKNATVPLTTTSNDGKTVIVFLSMAAADIGTLAPNNKLEVEYWRRREITQSGSTTIRTELAYSAQLVIDSITDGNNGKKTITGHCDTGDETKSANMRRALASVSYSMAGGSGTIYIDKIKYKVLSPNVAAVLSAAAYLSNDTAKLLIRMGSYLFVAPDGVVYETKNTEDNVPIFKIEEEAEIVGASFETVVEDKSEETGYAKIVQYIAAAADESDGDYRVVDGAVQRYIEKSGLWVTTPTFVRISAQTGAFGKLAEGDSITMKYNNDGVPGETIEGSFDGIISYDAVKGAFEEKSLKILKKGANNGTDFIIVAGYVYYAWTANHKEADYTDSENSFTFTRKRPNIAFACESQNRIWACSKDGHEIYASALGNPYNFYDYSGLATDSYAVNVGSDGLFTGCVNYMGQPLFFKENTLHYISGSYPSNNGSMDGMSYAVTTITDFKGVEKGSEKSFAIIDNILYYKSAAGIVAYDGANTVVISDALGKEKYKNAVAGAYKNKYYVSMQDKNGEYHLFVYDTELGTWCKEDNTQALQFIKVDNELLYADISDGCVKSVTDEDVLKYLSYEKEDDFEWECETGNFGYSYPNNKYLSRFQVRMQIADGAKASIYIQYNSDGVWHRKGEMTGKGVRTHLIPIVPIRCDHMKIKFAGKGDVKIFSIAKIFEEGGDV